ncbi:MULTISPECIES: DUF2809 domain-containing protein [unclassified Microcoleus]|uniref:ribosomal maturation YjgA family protein n=1 Tax=unclassified Microcoleus TaxID=2642155 RepID=UPI0025FB5414|nr:MULTISPECIES: DUF2809 domain-containing protein [unclassified Microcoleus]
MLYFNRKYFHLALILFSIEIVIAVFFTDKFVRYFLGDLLVVIFLYCFIMSWLRLESTKVALSVLTFSFVVEILQYFKILNALGWENNKIAIIILGNSFDAMDLVAYTAGIAIVLWLENRKKLSRS